MSDIVPDIVRFYEKISYDLRRCTAIVRLDIVHIPYRYSTDIVPILRYPHLSLRVPTLVRACVAREGPRPALSSTTHATPRGLTAASWSAPGSNPPSVIDSDLARPSASLRGSALCHPDPREFWRFVGFVFNRRRSRRQFSDGLSNFSSRCAKFPVLV